MEVEKKAGTNSWFWVWRRFVDGQLSNTPLLPQTSSPHFKILSQLFFLLFTHPTRLLKWRLFSSSLFSFLLIFSILFLCRTKTFFIEIKSTKQLIYSTDLLSFTHFSSSLNSSSSTKLAKKKKFFLINWKCFFLESPMISLWSMERRQTTLFSKVFSNISFTKTKKGQKSLGARSLQLLLL